MMLAKIRNSNTAVGSRMMSPMAMSISSCNVLMRFYYITSSSAACDNKNPMNDVISEYQKWKQQGTDLRVQARQAMESRFRDLLTEAVRIAEEYRSDFGSPLKPASPVTAFRYKKGAAKSKPKRSSGKEKVAAKAPEPRVEPKAQKPDKPDPKIAHLQKRLATARQKLEQAKAAAAPTRILEDRIYEIEDEIRLANQPV